MVIIRCINLSSSMPFGEATIALYFYNNINYCKYYLSFYGASNRQRFLMLRKISHHFSLVIPVSAQCNHKKVNVPTSFFGTKKASLFLHIYQIRIAQSLLLSSVLSPAFPCSTSLQTAFTLVFKSYYPLTSLKHTFAFFIFLQI